MENLKALTRETLIQLVIDYNNYISYLETTRNTYELINLRNQLSAQIFKTDEMNKTRQYWKDKYLNLKKESKDDGSLNLRRVANDIKPIIKGPRREKYIPENIERRKPIIKGPRPMIKVEENEYNDEEYTTDIIIENSKVYIPKNTYTHSVESTKGNISKAKHSGHKTKNELLVGTFPKGETKTFNSVERAKTYIRENYPEFKNSPLTNISRAARGSGFYTHNTAYNTVWRYICNETETADGCKIIRE